MRRTFKACAYRGHVFECRIRGLGSEELGELGHIDPRKSGSSKGRFYLIDIIDKLGMRLGPVWRSHIVQIP